MVCQPLARGHIGAVHDPYRTHGFGERDASRERADVCRDAAPTGRNRCTHSVERTLAGRAERLLSDRVCGRPVADADGRFVCVPPLAWGDNRGAGCSERGAPDRSLSPRPRRALRGAGAERAAGRRERSQTAQNLRVDQRRDRDLQPDRRPHYRGQQRVHAGHGLHARRCVHRTHGKLPVGETRNKAGAFFAS